MRVLALILDGLGVGNLHHLDMPYLQGLYKQEGDILCCSTVPHTAASNPMIWGGIHNTEMFWVSNPEAEEEKPYMDPAQYFDRDKGEPVEGAEHYVRKDFNDSFIWDDLYSEGYDSRALQVPITLPPYSFRVNNVLEESWFPDTQERMYKHIRKKPELIMDELADGAEFLATSIQMPDKWMHGVGEGEVDMDWVEDESPELDKKMADVIEFCKERDIYYLVFGDHGNPTEGAMLMDNFILPRHEKESVIISNADVPVYTDELYDWFRGVYEVPNTGIVPDEGADDIEGEEVVQRLKNLGYR